MESEETFNCYVHFGILKAQAFTWISFMLLNNDNSQGVCPQVLFGITIHQLLYTKRRDGTTVKYFLWSSYSSWKN